MPRYFINGKTYNIPDDRVQDFLSKNLGATKIEDSSVFGDVSLTNPNQGAFGNIEGPAQYFTPKPLQPAMPELNIEEYVKKDYKIDTNEEEDKFNEKYLKPLLNEEQWETWKVFTDIQRTTEITAEQNAQIQNEANVLFPTSEDGITSINNLNPEGLVTQEEIDEGAEKASEAIGSALPGGNIPIIQDVRAEVSGYFAEKLARWFGDDEMGDRKLLSEKEQQQITTQNKFIKQAEEELQKAVKKGEITELEATNPNKIAELAKRLYIYDEKYGITGVLQNNVIDKMRKDYSGFGRIAKSDLQKQLDEVYTIVEGGLKDITTKSLGVTKSAAARITAIDQELEELKNKEPKSVEELSALYLTVEKLIKERNQQQAMGEYNTGVQEFIVGGMEDVKRFGDMMGKNFNGITNFVGKFSVAAAEIVFNTSEMVDRFTNPRTIFSEVILPIAKSELPDSMNHIAVAAHALEGVDKALHEAKGIDLLGRRTKAEAWKAFDSWGEGMRDSLAPPQNFGDIRNASDVGNWILDFSASQMPQLVLLMAAPQVSLPILTASAGGSKFREMQKEMDAGLANYTPFQMYGAAGMTAAAEYFSEKLTLMQLNRLKISNIPVKGVQETFLEGLSRKIFNPKKIAGYLLDVNEEGITEMFATFGENFASKYIQGKEDVNLWDNVTEAYVGGVFMSGLLFRAPGVASQMMAPFRTNSVETAFADNAFQVSELSKELQKPDLNDKTRSIIESKINDLVKANVELRVNNSLAIDLLNQDQKNELVSLEQQRIQNNNTINQLSNDKNLDPKIAQQQIQQLKAENGKLEQQRDDIMQPVIDKRLEMGIEFAETQAKKLAGLEGSKLSGNVISDLSQQEILDKYGEQSAESAGFFDPDTGDIVINKDVASEFEMVTVGSHELFHGILKTEMAKNPELAAEFSTNFKNILSKSELDILNQRLEAVDENGERIYSEEYLERNPDEILTQFSDAILAGEIKFNESLFDKVRKLITPILKQVGFPKVEFKNAQETYDFIKDYTKFVKQSTLEGDARFDVSATGEFIAETDSQVGQGRDYTQRPKKEEEDEKAFSKPAAKGIPAEYDVDRIKTNIELNKDYGNTFIRENNRKKLEEQLARAEKVEALIDKSPAELREMLANETNAENKTDLEYALKRQQEVRFPGNVGVINPLTGESIKPAAPKGVVFSKPINPKNIVQNLNKKGLEVSEKQINDMVGKIASRATAKFWSRMSASNQNIVPRKLYKDSAKNLLLEIANNYRKEISKNTGKQVTFDAYMANTGMQRLNSLAADLGAKQKDDKSLSDEATLRKAEQQQTTEETTVAKPEVTPTIDVMSFPKITDSSVNTKTFEKDFSDALIKNAKEKGIDLSDPNLTTDQLQSITPYNILADALGIPANKISNPKANLSKDESLKIQRALLKARSFVKNVVLGKANKDVQEVESKVKGGKPVKIGGESLKLGRNILKTFFNPPKRLGSGQMVRTPKKFDNKVYEQSIGIKDGKVDPNYKPRDAESQVMKGFLKAIAEQMANRSIARSPKATPEVKANLDRGKGSRVFARVSKKSRFQKAMEPKVDFQIRTNKEGKKIKLPKTSTILKNEIKNNIVPVLKDNLTPEQKVLLLYTMQGTGKDKLDGNLGRSGMIYPNIAAAREALGLTEAQVKKISADPKIQNILNYAGKPVLSTSNLSLDILNDLKINKDNIQNTVVKENKAKEKALSDLLTSLINIVKENPSLANGINHILGLQSDYQGHFIRKLIPFVSFTDPSLLQEGIHDEHYSKSLRTTRFAQEMMVEAKNEGENYTEKDIKDDLNKLKKGLARGVVSANDGKNFDKRKKVDKGAETGIDKQPIDEVFENVENPKLHWVLPNTRMNPSSEIQTLEFIKNQNKIETTLDSGRAYSKSPRGKKAIEKLKDSQPKDLDKGFNDIIQETKGIKSEARYSDIGARRAGRTKGRFRFFIPPGAEDFKGLLYNFLGKGKAGERHFEFFDKNLLKPYWQAIAQIERFRRALKNDYATLLKASPDVRKKLGQKIPTKGKTQFTYDHAIRAYLMTESGYDLTEAGLSKRDAKLLVDTVKNNPELIDFANNLQLISKQDKWLKPTGGFDVQTIQSDIHRFTSGEGRKKFLDNSGFMQNVNEIFSKENLNKIEAAYGKNVREALEDTIYRMKNGTNRPAGTNRLTNTFNNWVNRSVGAIMFFNRKSALLQTISSVNFINWSDNNPIKAAMAFANQKQYWSDFAFIFNSPKLKERRAGLKGDINEAEIADAARGATNKAEAVLSYLLKIGFTPTQLADSFAIASGGATFYRNRINTYLKQGMNQQAAEKKAWQDFSRISEESQQSADPAMISEQQASPLGRFTLNFQNTPMQYTRLMKRAGQDLINRRRIPGLTQAQSDATYISKIIYYGAVQNFIFAALQNALFAVIPGFGGEDDEEELTKEQRKRKKELRIANNMVDTLLRGTGIYGAIAATLKNTVIKFYENEQKDPFAKDNADIILEAANLSPVIGSKLRKLNNALKTREFEKDVIEERGWEITRDGRLNLSPSYNVLGSTAEALLNIPLERTIAEIDALVEMTDQRNSSLERIALALGWRTWDIGVPNEEEDQIKVEVKERKKQERKDKLRREKEEKKRLEEEKRFEGLTNKEINALKRKDQIEALTKQQQVDSLLKLGVTKKEIRSLRLEEDRINKIIELNTK